MTDANTVPKSPERSAPRPTRRLGGLHWVHWTIVAASLVLTLAASWITASQAEARRRDGFEQEANQAVGLLLERMEKYEGGLWAGVGLVQSFGDTRRLVREDWVQFAGSIDLVGRYPGLNGFGVVYHVTDDDLPGFIKSYAREHPELPAFRVHPEIDSEHHFPITYLEPLKGNEEAIGLDLAFEKHRREAALRAMQTGKAQITGPIILVQDAGKTPGFLFYAPFYDQDDGPRTMSRFRGMVYAPFVVRRLMAGTLEQEKRSVELTIRDGDTTLYSEASESADAPTPLFTRVQDVDLYGRRWQFELNSTPAFQRQHSQTQALTIMVCGLLIDGLLLAIFRVLARSRQRAEELAASKTVELRETIGTLSCVNEALGESNRDLEQFAFIASHDLQAPMRTVGNYARFLKEDLEGRLSEDEVKVVDTIIRAADRMKCLTSAVLDFSRVGAGEDIEVVDLQQIVDDVLWELSGDIAAADAQVEVVPLPSIRCRPTAIAMLFRNLFSNALKFRRADLQLHVEVTTRRVSDRWQVRVADNAVGIDAEHREAVFEIFKRLHRNDEIPGSGIGLSICRKIVKQIEGEISIEPNPGGGTVVVVDLPASALATTESASRPDSATLPV